LQPAAQGKLRLFDTALGTMAYLATLKMRTHIGLVQGRGGLLANRTVHDNVHLPLSIHGGLTHDQEVTRVNALLDDMELLSVQGLRPHLLDEAVRFRACAARALVLQPSWLVVEGMGDFEPTAHGSHTWQRMLHHVDAAHGAVVVCLPRPIVAFARWWTSQGGHVLDCPLADSLPAIQAGSVAP
jgi:ABC-type ATPase involved in cell division